MKNQFYCFDGSYLYIRSRKYIAFNRALIYAKHAQFVLKYIIETTLKMCNVWLIRIIQFSSMLYPYVLRLCNFTFIFEYVNNKCRKSPRIIAFYGRKYLTWYNNEHHKNLKPRVISIQKWIQYINASKEIFYLVKF